ncbi:hypothetical protein C0993_006771 [Termitomyces sp. T159_Od127]|nr:hypothetical protein C0993_006771 [Termitomyces sp. T159_Od127]
MAGGGMAGKMVEESRKAWIAHFEAQKKEKDKKVTSRITITPSGSVAFVVEGDSDMIATYIANHSGVVANVTRPEFAGLASDSLSITSMNNIEAMEFNMLVALEEELRVDINWFNNRNSDGALSSTVVSCEVMPFY